MGLGGGRKRVKINHDPNNTQWSRSTTNYGHRMLVSQGWAPGQVLGASHDSEYAAKHLTEASKSHIKASFREENLGLGAKRGSGQEAGECVGLDAFQGLLGRLNGKSDEILEKEQRSRDDLKRARYIEHRGTVRFVQGGTLTSDMDELVELARKSKIDFEARVATEEVAKPQREKKKLKKERRETTTLTDDFPPSELAETVSEEPTKADKRKNKKRKNREVTDSTPKDVSTNLPTISSEEQNTGGPGTVSEDVSMQSNSEDEIARKARRKSERAEKREKKQRRREERAARKAAAATATSEMKIDESRPEKVVKETIIMEPVTEPKDAPSGQSSVGGRHTSVRSRYIAAKRRAVMDPRALKEILMAKA